MVINGCCLVNCLVSILYSILIHHDRFAPTSEIAWSGGTWLFLPWCFFLFPRLEDWCLSSTPDQPLGHSWPVLVLIAPYWSGPALQLRRPQAFSIQKSKAKNQIPKWRRENHIFKRIRSFLSSSHKNYKVTMKKREIHGRYYANKKKSRTFLQDGVIAFKKRFN